MSFSTRRQITATKRAMEIIQSAVTANASAVVVITTAVTKMDRAIIRRQNGAMMHQHLSTMDTRSKYRRRSRKWASMSSRKRIQRKEKMEKMCVEKVVVFQVKNCVLFILIADIYLHRWTSITSQRFPRKIPKSTRPYKTKRPFRSTIFQHFCIKLIHLARWAIYRN